MPTVIYKKSELKKLIGRKISDEQLADTIALIKPNLEKVEGEEITVEHTADRPDLFSSEGLSRAVSSYLGFRTGLSKYTVFKPKIEVKMKTVAARPYVSTLVVRGVKMDEEVFASMINMQELLNDSLGRNRSKAAIGIHDLDKITGPISYIGSSRDETFVPLDSKEEMTLEDVTKKMEKGVKYAHLLSDSKSWPVFTDANGIFSLPPILNSDRTKVTMNTKNFFVEVTGTDKKVVGQVMAILASNFAERKFSLESVKMKREKRSETTPDLAENIFEIDIESVNKVIGTKISPKDVEGLLARMGYDTLLGPNNIEVIAPAYRVDLLHPVDIIEDIAIAYGYNNLKPEIPNISTIGRSLEIESVSKKAAMSMVGFGFQEIMSSVLSTPANQFRKMNLPEIKIVEIENPSSSEFTCARINLLPSLLKVLAANKHYEYPQNIFEIGDVVIPDKEEETLARNERRISGVVCHSRAGFAEVEAIVEGLMKNLGLGFSLKECESDVYIPGRGVDMYIDKKYVGTFGELHPQVIQNWDIGMPTAAFEISLESI